MESTANLSECLTGTLVFKELSRRSIRPLIELNDRINALSSLEEGINSTRIVVAGDQSHGKTSLLEALTEVDLPRGEGITTRVPLVIQLRSMSDSSEEEHAIISLESGSSSKKERIFLHQIASKIEDMTEELAGKEQDVVDKPIELRIFRHDQQDLSVVDLPGISRVALQGQAGGDGKLLEARILDMCKRYMKPEQSLLLNVVSSMVDVCTSASLQLSSELDPTGERTLLCLTKIDELQQRSLADIMETSIGTLNLRAENVFAVRNRSQKEVESRLNGVAARKCEVEALHRHPKLHERSTEVGFGLGVPALAQRLVTLQHSNIRKELPNVSRNILQRLKELQAQLEKLGPPELSSESESRLAAMSVIDQCIEAIKAELSGRIQAESLPPIMYKGMKKEDFQLLCSLLSDHEKELGNYFDGLYPYTYFFSQEFRKKLTVYIDAAKGGVGLPGAIEPHVCSVVIASLLEPTSPSIDRMLNSMRKDTELAVERCLTSAMERKGLFRHALQQLLLQASNEIFEKSYNKARHLVSDILNWEKHLLKTSNDQYVDTVRKLRSNMFTSTGKPLHQFSVSASPALSVQKEVYRITKNGAYEMSNEDQKLLDLQIELFAYWEVIKKRVIDYLQLAARAELAVLPIQGHLKSKMIERVLASPSCVELMKSPFSLRRKKEGLKARIAKLLEAHELLKTTLRESEQALQQDFQCTTEPIADNLQDMQVGTIQENYGSMLTWCKSMVYAGSQ